jgi:hypothetical protein
MKKKASRGASVLRSIADEVLTGVSGGFTGLGLPEPAPRTSQPAPTSSISLSYGSIEWKY